MLQAYLWRGQANEKEKIKRFKFGGQVILAERDGIDASKKSATYIHFKLKKEILLERQNPEWRDLNYDLTTLPSADKLFRTLLVHKAKRF